MSGPVCQITSRGGVLYNTCLLSVLGRAWGDFGAMYLMHTLWQTPTPDFTSSNSSSRTGYLPCMATSPILSLVMPELGTDSDTSCQCTHPASVHGKLMLLGCHADAVHPTCHFDWVEKFFPSITISLWNAESGIVIGCASCWHLIAVGAGYFGGGQTLYFEDCMYKYYCVCKECA